MTCHKTMNQNENWIFQVQKKRKKTFEKKRFETTLTQNQLSLDLEKIITVGMKMFFVIFGRIYPILDDFGDFSSVLHRYVHF